MKAKLSSYIGTLLDQYIEETLRRNKEPIRKNSPDGYSNKKLKASLLLISVLDQRTIADLSNNGWGLVRKWNSEKRFKEKVEANRKGFVKFVERRVRGSAHGGEVISRFCEELHYYDLHNLDIKTRILLMSWAIKQMGGDFSSIDTLMKVENIIFGGPAINQKLSRDTKEYITEQMIEHLQSTKSSIENRAVALYLARLLNTHYRMEGK